MIGGAGNRATTGLLLAEEGATSPLRQCPKIFRFLEPSTVPVRYPGLKRALGNQDYTEQRIAILPLSDIRISSLERIAFAKSYGR